MDERECCVVGRAAVGILCTKKAIFSAAGTADPTRVTTRLTGHMLIVVAGLPGSGKSTLADALGLHLKAPVLAVDPIENAILSAGLEPGWEAGVAAYEAAGAMAVANLLLGLTVIVDSVSDSEPARQTWWTAAERAAAPTKVIEVRCSDAAEHRRRLEHRQRGLSHVPEPAWEDVLRRAESYAPWNRERLVVDSAGSLDAMVTAALDYLSDCR
jgi:predicted kinase